MIVLASDEDQIKFLITVLSILFGILLIGIILKCTPCCYYDDDSNLKNKTSQGRHFSIPWICMYTKRWTEIEDEDGIKSTYGNLLKIAILYCQLWSFVMLSSQLIMWQCWNILTQIFFLFHIRLSLEPLEVEQPQPRLNAQMVDLQSSGNFSVEKDLLAGFVVSAIGRVQMKPYFVLKSAVGKQTWIAVTFFFFL